MFKRRFFSHARPQPGRPRLVPRGQHDRLRVCKKGHRRHRVSDLYLKLLEASWLQLLMIFASTFILLNFPFAFAYVALGNSIMNARPGSLLDAYFFSVQTMSTIGYGRMAPLGTTANLLVMMEAMIGMLFIAVSTGLFFSKFSRPVAKILFSNHALISNYNGVPHLIIRLANERNNRIVDAKAQMVILRKETSSEGIVMHRFYDLPLQREQIPVLQFTWTLMHPITENSPLHDTPLETLKEWNAEILVSLTGIDETFSQTIHARHSYIVEDIIQNALFVDIIKRREDDNGLDIDFTAFHDVRRVD